MFHGALPVANKRKKLLTKRRIIVLVILAVTVFGTGSYFYWGPGRSMINQWRADSHLEEARELVESKQWQNVFLHANESMKLKPSLEAARLIVRSAREARAFNNRQFLLRAIQLFRFDGATLEDRVLALQFSLDCKDLEATNGLIRELSPEELTEPPVRFQLVRGALLSGNYAQAVAIANQLTGQDDPAIDLMLAIHLARSGIEGTKAEINKRLRSVIQSDDPTLSLGGFELLISLRPSWVQASLVKEAIERFDGDENLGPLRELHLEHLKAKVGQQDLDATVAKAIENYREEHLTPLTDWLAKIGRFPEILEITADEEDQKAPNVFAIRLSALEATGDWEGLKAALAEPPVTIPEPLHLALQALIDSKQGDMLAAEAKWKLALSKAQSDEEKNWFYQLSQVAARAGNRDVQMEMLVRAIIRKDGIPPSVDVLNPLFEWLVEMEDEERLLDVTGQLLRREPRHPVLINNYLYLKALYRGAEPKDAEILAELVKTYPDKTGFRHTLAFLRLMLDEYQTALEVLNAIPEGEEQATDSSLAVRAHALYGLGQKEEARALAETVQWSNLNARQRMVLQLPPTPEELNKSLYQEALYEKVKSEDADVLADLVKDDPDRADFRLTLALMRLILDEHQAALETLDGIPDDNENPSDLVRAMRAHALFGLGQEEKARTLAETVQWSKLNTREKQILELPPPPEEVSKSLYQKAVNHLARAKDRKTLEDFLRSDPDNAGFRRSLAMVQLMLDEYQAALDTLDANPANEGNPSHLISAMRARALFGLGQEERARALAGTVEWSSLSSRERKVLELPPPAEEVEGE